MRALGRAKGYTTWLKVWWPETGSNRRRRPFQGCLPSMLSGLGSVEVVEGISFTGNGFGLEWDHLGSFRFLCVRYLYVATVSREVCHRSGSGRNFPWNSVKIGRRDCGGGLSTLRAWPSPYSVSDGHSIRIRRYNIRDGRRQFPVRTEIRSPMRGHCPY